MAHLVKVGGKTVSYRKEPHVPVVVEVVRLVEVERLSVRDALRHTVQALFGEHIWVICRYMHVS